MTVGITLDTGALIARERGDRRFRGILDEATLGGIRVTVPAAVVAETWRGSSRRLAGILTMVEVEPMTERLAKLTGEALAAVKGSTLVDALVMVSAALRGDVVYTADVADLVRLRDGHVKNTRVLRV
jgi:predicted nucleic acid-binding protein